jgi:hypothetical protein
MDWDVSIQMYEYTLCSTLYVRHCSTSLPSDIKTLFVLRKVSEGNHILPPISFFVHYQNIYWVVLNFSFFMTIHSWIWFLLISYQGDGTEKTNNALELSRDSNYKPFWIVSISLLSNLCVLEETYRYFQVFTKRCQNVNNFALAILISTEKIA